MALRRALLATFGVLSLTAAPAAASGGGASAPPAGVPLGDDGGVAYGQIPKPRVKKPAIKRPHKPRRRSSRGGRLTLSSFEVGRPRLFLYGRPARLTFSVQGRARRVRMRLTVLRADSRAVVARIPLGERSTGTRQFIFFTGREGGELPQGRYLLRLSARARARHKGRSASASSVGEIEFFHHRFPVAGPFSYGGPDGRFGAPRPGHTHQGQDLPAAEGTPLVAPRGGVIKAVRYQAAGAGYYVVLHGEGEDRDYVFMHLRSGSVVVGPGQHVRTGQRIADVGSTGESSGPHLHFEIWVGGGWYSGGHPIDPLPLLRQWDRWS